MVSYTKNVLSTKPFCSIRWWLWSNKTSSIPTWSTLSLILCLLPFVYYSQTHLSIWEKAVSKSTCKCFSCTFNSHCANTHNMDKGTEVILNHRWLNGLVVLWSGSFLTFSLLEVKIVSLEIYGEFCLLLDGKTPSYFSKARNRFHPLYL